MFSALCSPLLKVLKPDWLALQGSLVTVVVCSLCCRSWLTRFDNHQPTSEVLQVVLKVSRLVLPELHLGDPTHVRSACVMVRVNSW